MVVFFCYKTFNYDYNKMKKLERLFRKIGNADVHVWGYSTLGILPKEKI